MKESEEIIQALLKFRNERDWEQFHNPKDLALAISIESAELLELFLWKKADEANTEKVKVQVKQTKKKLKKSWQMYLLLPLCLQKNTILM